MSDNKKNDALITSEDHSVRLRSSSLVRRGLDQIAKANPSEQEDNQDAAPRISEAEITEQLEGFGEHLDEVEEQANSDEHWRRARANSPLYQETTYEQRKANGLSAYEAFLRKGKEGIREHLNQMELRKHQVRDDSPTSAPVDSSQTSGKDGNLQYSLGKSYVKSGRVSEAFHAFETALAAQNDSGLYRYALGLVAALMGDDLGVFEQEEALAAKGLTPLSDDLFQFLNKHSGHIAELAEDEEFNTLMCQLVESKIHAAELLTGMAQEFDGIAAGSDA
jgi:tetratricopeptide (TPR) repeat protein